MLFNWPNMFPAALALSLASQGFRFAYSSSPLAYLYTISKIPYRASCWKVAVMALEMSIYRPISDDFTNLSFNFGLFNLEYHKVQDRR